MDVFRFSATNFWHVILIYLAALYGLSLLLIFAKIEIFSTVWNYIAIILFVLNFVFLFWKRPRIIIDKRGLKCEKLIGGFFIPASETVTMKIKEKMVRARHTGMDWIYLLLEDKSGKILGKTMLTLFWNRSDLKNLASAIDKCGLPISIDASFNNYLKGNFWRSTAFKDV